jgi:hypothetical protein
VRLAQSVFLLIFVLTLGAPGSRSTGRVATGRSRADQLEQIQREPPCRANERYGSRYLAVVADVRGARLPELRLDSSEPAAAGVNYGLPLLGGVGLFIAGTLLMLLWRTGRRLSPSGLTLRGMKVHNRRLVVPNRAGYG